MYIYCLQVCIESESVSHLVFSVSKYDQGDQGVCNCLQVVEACCASTADEVKGVR
jgi:hypothetical protein